MHARLPLHALSCMFTLHCVCSGVLKDTFKVLVRSVGVYVSVCVIVCMCVTCVNVLNWSLCMHCSFWKYVYAYMRACMYVCLCACLCFSFTLLLTRTWILIVYAVRALLCMYLRHTSSNG
eukprot:GDKI01016044.1.p1 GENE.GDKI01016044.1~~GDKI01016044.1.p1  ORF type:complete len:120 (+),score=15.19 GDKI01016044.1:32-391(+)